MNIEDKEKILEQIKQQHNNITNTLQIPNNIIQFGQPGYYPECLISDFLSSYCKYCGDLLCSCEYFMEQENGKRQHNSNVNNSENFDRNNEPHFKKTKLN